MSLEVNGISKQYGNFTALYPLSFTLSEPGVYALLGTNGAGKTTAIRIILGMLSRNSGEVLWNGKALSPVTEKVGYLAKDTDAVQNFSNKVEQGRKELTTEEKQELKDTLGWGEKQITKCTTGDDGVIYYKTDRSDAEKTGLTENEQAEIIKETGWPAEIVNCIESIDQCEVYKNADLHEAEIDGRKCLVKNIDMDYVDPKTGLTNRELMEKGRAPIDAKTGESIELHHMGQNFNSPFAELCANSEHGDGKDAILHDKKVESWRQDPEKKNQYNNVQRPNHWKARAEEM